MKMSKKQASYLVAGCAVLCLFGLSIILVYKERSAMHRARDVFYARHATLLKVYDQPWWPSHAAQKALEVSIQSKEKTLNLLEESFLGPNKGQFSPSPKRATDMVFHLQATADRLRNGARDARVDLSDQSEGFGFGQLLDEGVPPSPAALVRLDRERQLIEFLANALFSSHPQQLSKVEREAIESGGPMQTKDTFIPAGRDWDALQVLSYDIIPVRFTFEGDTQHLRSFVNEIAASDWPLVIIDVAANPSKIRGRPQYDTLIDPIVSPVPMEFQVTVAWVGGTS